jgi:hypothetical protein
MRVLSRQRVNAVEMAAFPAGRFGPGLEIPVAQAVHAIAAAVPKALERADWAFGGAGGSVEIEASVEDPHAWDRRFFYRETESASRRIEGDFHDAHGDDDRRDSDLAQKGNRKGRMAAGHSAKPPSQSKHFSPARVSASRAARIPFLA